MADEKELSLTEKAQQDIATLQSKVEHLEKNQSDFLMVIDQLQGRLEALETAKGVKFDKGALERIAELERRAGI